jgi:asparaginyl-tRNA synthetase
MGHAQSPDAEIDWAGEAMLSRKADKPFFITDYPKGSRGFYDRESHERPGFLRNFDLIAPEGYGELCSRQRAGERLRHHRRADAGDRRESGQVRLVPATAA